MNDMNYIFFYLLLNILATYIIFKYFDLFFRKKLVIKEEYTYFVAIVYYICISFIHLYVNDPILTMVGNILLFYAISLIYQSDLKKRILSVLLIYLVLLFVECVAVLFVSFFSTKHKLILGFALSKIITIILLGLFNRYCSLKEELLIPKLQLITIFLFPLGSIVLFYILIEYAPENISLLGLCILLLFIIMIYYVLDRINHNYQIILNNEIEIYKKELESQIYEQEKLSYQNQLEIYQRQKEEILSFQHDLKNHMIGIYNLIENQDMDGLKEYLKRIESTEILKIIDTGHLLIDSIMNYELSKAKEKNIAYEVDIMIPADMKIDSFDINVILGNLMENAIEALEKCPVDQRKLYIHINYEIGLLYITIENNYVHSIKKGKNGKIISTKNDDKKHGIGLENIKRSVARYNGYMEIETNYQIFSVNILLYV